MSPPRCMPRRTSGVDAALSTALTRRIPGSGRACNRRRPGADVTATLPVHGARSGARLPRRISSGRTRAGLRRSTAQSSAPRGRERSPGRRPNVVGQAAPVFTATLPAGLLVSGVNKVEVGARIMPGNYADWVYANYWEVDYRRLFRAWQGPFRLPDRGDGSTRVRRGRLALQVSVTILGYLRSQSDHGADRRGGCIRRRAAKRCASA